MPIANLFRAKVGQPRQLQPPEDLTSFLARLRGLPTNAKSKTMDEKLASRPSGSETAVLPFVNARIKQRPVSSARLQIEDAHSGSGSKVTENEKACAINMRHIWPIELGGLSMRCLVHAMKSDAVDQDALIPLISEMLTFTVERNDKMKQRANLQAFEGDKAPVTIAQYVKRIVKYGGCSSCTFLVGLMYLNRLKRIHPILRITSTNFQRLFLVAVMTAAKFLDDYYFSNRHWAHVGGMETSEINELELELLFRISFNLYVSREDYDDFGAQLQDCPPEPISPSPSRLSLIDRLEHRSLPKARSFEDFSHARNPTKSGPISPASSSSLSRCDTPPQGRSASLESLFGL